MFQLRQLGDSNPSAVVFNANTAPTQIVDEANGTSAAWVTKLWGSPLYSLLRTASFAVSTFHGYKRNGSVGWAIWWGLMGALFPIITPTIALAQGFGKAK